MRFETLAVHSGNRVDPSTGAVAPPIHLSTTFQRDEQGQTTRGFSYIRDGNPTQSLLEETLTTIECGEVALCFASGMAAASALMQSFARGTRLLLPEDGYYAVRKMAAEFAGGWGIEHRTLAMHDLEKVRSSLDGVHALWLETPSNPQLRITDIESLAAEARRRGVIVIADGTFATPALQQPLRLGADIVLHSTTKYLGGHSDVQGGALVFRERSALSERVELARRLLGAVASPFNCWLVQRGIRSLAARMRVHSENALHVAEHLARHPRVEAVFYPGLRSHPNHAVAARQMRAFGGMLSFLLRGDRAAALRVTARTQLFVRATSLGGVESLIEHRQSSEGTGSTAPPNLIRLSIGLEHPQDLTDDLDNALKE